MEQSGGATGARRPNPSPPAAAGACGEDRLSALPEDVLVLILLRFDTAAPVRTCAVSRGWHRVWALLPEFRFHLAPDGHRIREILDAPEALSLFSVSVTTEGAGPESAAAWLPVAARRLSGDLAYHNIATPMNEDDDGGGGEEAVGRGDVLLPCFEKATSVELNMGFLGLALPSVGFFARLTELSLMRVDFHGPCELGSAVSSLRCPLLKKLEVCNSMGLHNLSIHSESLLQIVLKNLGSLRELTMVAPTLQKLNVKHSLSEDDESEPVANISAPQLVSLTWRDVYDPESVHLGNLGRLQRLTTSFFNVYGLQEDNQSCLSLLQRFKVVDRLRLPLVWQSACPSGCLCDQPTSWKTEELLLNHLEDIRILNLKGADHEVAFLKQLFNWATVLKKVWIAFDYQVSKSKAKEFHQALAGSSRPETTVGFYMYHNADKRLLFLLKPEGQGTGL